MIYQASYSVAGVNTPNSILANLKAGADRVKLLEWIVSVEIAQTTAPVLQLERMNAVGTGTITTSPNGPSDVADATATAVLEIGWATLRPTRLATPVGLRRCQLQAAIASAFIFDFTNRPLIIAPNGGLMLNLVTASGATLGTLGGSVTWDE